MINYINANFTLDELSNQSGTREIIDRWQPHIDFLSENCNPLVESGRHNHIIISSIISQISDGTFIIGGQGNKEPDLYYEEIGSKARTEQKGFEKGSSVAWVAKSTFFASNHGARNLKEWVEKEKPSEEEKKKHMIKKSYSDDEYYLLTATAQWDGDIRSTLCFFVEAKVLHQCLIGEHVKNKPYCFVDLELLLQKTSKLT